MNTIQLPSAHQVGATVTFSLGETVKITAEVTAVKFITGKVLYDLDLIFSLPEDAEQYSTRIHGVDSAFVS